MGVLGLHASSPASAQSAAALSADEIVVTAQRSGIPVWRVRSGRSTLVLVGTIEGIAEGTEWYPDQLAAALRGADQVMFPQGTQLRAGVFQMLGLGSKVKKMERMPGNQSLAPHLSREQLNRMMLLQERGLLQRDFLKRRPIFNAYDLMVAAKGERKSGGFLSVSRVDWKSDPDAFVRYTANRYHLRVLPMRTVRLSAALNDIDRLPPAAQIPCLLAAADFAEAPPGHYRARSEAWIKKRIPDVINSPAEKAIATCAKLVRKDADPRPVLLDALRQPLTTVAVLDLSVLGARGGVLDYFDGLGFEISGPPWKR